MIQLNVVVLLGDPGFIEAQEDTDKVHVFTCMFLGVHQQAHVFVIGRALVQLYAVLALHLVIILETNQTNVGKQINQLYFYLILPALAFNI